jgi:uncharacterized protein YbjT (DUF2867 family)
MTILVTGSGGTIGSLVVTQLVERGAEVHALARSPNKARFPDGVTVVKGDMTDVETMRAALSRVSTLFLLNAVVPDEVTQALITLNLAREAGIERIVYFSVIHSDRYINVPHFAGKYVVERLLVESGMSATILRPAYFMQNDANLKGALLDHSTYAMPIGGAGVSMVDTRDLAEVAALHLLRRENSAVPLALEILDVVGPDVLTGAAIAAIWTAVMARSIGYAGDDVAAFERQMKTFAPSWMAYDMRLMLSRIQEVGMTSDSSAVERLTALLGRPLRSYRDFAVAAAEQWTQGGALRKSA